jgi:hypothetical protein
LSCAGDLGVQGAPEEERGWAMGDGLEIPKIRDIEGFMGFCRLSATEKHVIRLLNSIPVEAMTLDKISRIFGISRERVRQIEAESIAKMKKNLRIKHHFLGGYLNAA